MSCCLNRPIRATTKRPVRFVSGLFSTKGKIFYEMCLPTSYILISKFIICFRASGLVGETSKLHANYLIRESTQNANLNVAMCSNH